MDPFVRKMQHILPQKSCIRAYADDLAVVSPNFQSLPALRNLFELLGHAANLKINVSKTVVVPLYSCEASHLQHQLSCLGWSGVMVQKDVAKYLGFWIGPGATAETNFQEPLSKFHKRALFWLSKPELGPTLSTLAFNTFVLPTLSFVAQLYRAPPIIQQDIRQVALKLAKGPKGWIDGKNGQAFFDASEVINLKTVPRSPETHLEAIFWSAGMKFMFSPGTKVNELETGLAESFLLIRETTGVVNASPFFQFSEFSRHVQSLGLVERLTTPDNMGTVAQLYKLLFPQFNAPGSLITHMQKTYRNRWCKPDILGNIPYHKLVQRLIGKLKFFSSQIPPKVLANVRWHLNGFHMSRRYQKQGVCLFCKNRWSVDSIEHMSKCKS